MQKSIKLVIVVTTFFTAKLSAEPLFIYFNEMMNKSSLIVMGTYLGCDGKNPYESFHYYFLAKEVVKGKISKDTLVFQRAQGAVYLETGKEYVAFINQDNGFEWVGSDKVGKKITDESLLFLEGFYDYNAYLVSPSMVSYAQLKDYVTTSTFNGSMYGDVHFFNTHEKKMKPSTIHLEIKYSYSKGQLSSDISLEGIKLNDFNKSPAFSLPCWDDIISVVYEPNLVRPLTFNGKLNNLHPSSHRFRVTFWVNEPEELSYEEFNDYVGNNKNGPGYFILELSLNNQTFNIHLNEERGRIGKLIQFNGENLNISSLSDAPERSIVFGYPESKYKLVLDDCKIDKSVFEFSEYDLITELKVGPITGKWVDLKNPGTGIKCTLTYKATHFTVNQNYGK